MIKLIIFDFDGTLVDSIGIIYKTIKKEVEEGCCPLSKNFRRDMGDWPLEEHLKREGVCNREAIITKIKEDLRNNIEKVKLAKGMKNLRKIEIPKVILSNNSGGAIKKLLDRHRIEFFEEVHSPKEFHNKTEGLKRVIKSWKLKPFETIYIGDRDRDIFSAKKVGCVSIGIFNHISWSTKEELIESEPDFLISRLDDLGNIVKELNSS